MRVSSFDTMSCCRKPWFSRKSWGLVLMILLMVLLYIGVVTSYSWLCKERSCFGSFSSMIPSLDESQRKVDDTVVLLYNLNMSVNNSSENLAEREIRIHYFNPTQWHGPDTFKKCSHKCSISFGRKYKQYSTSQFVIFDGSANLPDKPPPKPVGQTWIYHGMEPPFLQPRLHHWKRKINWTISYRRDADFTHVYGTMLFKEVKGTERIRLNSNWEGKTNGNAWFVSHPNVPSRRAEFARHINNTINVDIYSNNKGEKKCPSSTINNCYKLLSDKYKFYLSFENTLCRDYVTEKCFKIYAAQADVIPVVRGTPDYSLFAPPQSYIDTTKFNDISSLAVFQMELANNQTAFENYFQWRKDYYNEPTGSRAFCQLCAQAHRTPIHHKLYDSLETWVQGDNSNPMCRKVTDIK